MGTSTSARAPHGAVSGVRRRSRRGGVPQGTAWGRPYKRAQRALYRSAKFIVATVQTVAEAGRCASRPVRSTWILIYALRKVTAASAQHAKAKRWLAEAVEAFAAMPP